MKISAIFYGAGFPLPLIVLLLAVCCRLPPAASGCWVVPELAAQRQRRRRFVPTTTSPAPPSSDESSSRYNDKSGGGGSSASRPSIRIPFLGRDVVEGGRYALHLEATSLIGGPSWLPIHGKVVLVDRRKSSSRAGSTTTTGGGAGDGAYSTESRYEFDFIPVDPKNPKTMGRLVSLRRTPGQIRLKKLPDMTKTVINPAGDGNAKRGEEEEGGRRLAAAFLAKIRDRLRNSSSAAAAAAAVLLCRSTRRGRKTYDHVGRRT